MKNKQALYEPGAIYHVYNHGNARDNLFLSSDNYRFFLTRCHKYIQPFADILAWCLMPNHFHLVLRIRPAELFSPGTEHPPFLNADDFHKWITQQFSNCFNSYAKAFNKQQARRGSLFLKSVNRLFVSDEEYLKQLILYVHANPVKHGFCRWPGQWLHSSYRTFLRSVNDPVADEVIGLFGNKENFIAEHDNFCRRFIPFKAA